jgi:hypothetical protein
VRKIRNEKCPLALEAQRAFVKYQDSILQHRAFEHTGLQQHVWHAVLQLCFCLLAVIIIFLSSV